MSWVDLSHSLGERIATFPGAPQAEIETIATIGQNGYGEKRLYLNSHSGTHIDSPAHMLMDGNPLNRMPLSAFTGKGVVLPATDYPQEIPPQVLQTLNIDEDVDFVLFYTGWDSHWNTNAYFGNFPYLSVSSAQKLAELSLKGVGFDTPSADAMDSKELSNHHIFFRAGMIILENLTNLNKLVGKKFQLFCFPLNIENGDGSPVRAVALIDEE